MFLEEQKTLCDSKNTEIYNNVQIKYELSFSWQCLLASRGVTTCPVNRVRYAFRTMAAVTCHEATWVGASATPPMHKALGF